MKNSISIHSIVAVAITSMIACGGSEADDLREQLAQQDGGFDTADELQMFGQSQSYLAIDEAEADPAADDAMTAGPEVTSLEAAAGNVYYLAVATGHLHHDGEPADTSGSITVSRGAVVVLRTIKLEQDDDQLLPRTDPRKVEWLSSTVYVDGLLVKIIDDPSAGVAGEVTLVTGQLTETIPMAELSAMTRLGKLSNGLKLAAAASIVDPTDASAGFCGARFRKVAEDVGTFRGKWVDQRGVLDGHIKGVWGKHEGHQIFFGKYISDDGSFKGLLSGTYGDNLFRGSIRDDAGTVIGELEGRYGFNGFGVCRWDTQG